MRVARSEKEGRDTKCPGLLAEMERFELSRSF